MKGDPCTIGGCERPQRAHGWCGTHYERWRRHGTTDDPVRITHCTVDGCDRPHIARGLCEVHYRRMHHNWSPDGRTVRDPICTIEGCDRPHSGRGLCGTHHERWRKHGDPLTVLIGNWSGDDVGYGGMHDRTRRQRGPASAHQCSHCERSALHWAYDHLDDNERIRADGRRYSCDTAHYIPLCPSCHKKFDSLTAPAA